MINWLIYIKLIHLNPQSDIVERTSYITQLLRTIQKKIKCCFKMLQYLHIMYYIFTMVIFYFCPNSVSTIVQNFVQWAFSGVKTNRLPNKTVIKRVSKQSPCFFIMAVCISFHFYYQWCQHQTPNPKLPIGH